MVVIVIRFEINGILYFCVGILRGVLCRNWINLRRRRKTQEISNKMVFPDFFSTEQSTKRDIRKELCSLVDAFMCINAFCLILVLVSAPIIGGSSQNVTTRKDLNIIALNNNNNFKMR